ncbi:glycosyltransferase family 4 protein [Novosphingobium malaysiense]|uniref:glycosyltransferase family 4 protein n=1 Tax=Novosphingobium malaysiense TaxID=1348853 RepID=UPI0012E04B68|nr:glycosyltransferase family 1 protein [Novosphingobium malaysiense]
MGPVLRENQFVLIHDTQIYDMPESYAPAFRATYRLLQPWLARRARKVGTVSEHSRGRMQVHGLAKGRRIEVIANGADHAAFGPVDGGVFERHGLEPGKYLLAMSQAAPHKNIAMLLEACTKRADRSIPLVLAGQAGAAAFGLEEANLPEDVRFIGRVSDPELNALYRNARLLLFPSHTEGFGFPVLEAMSCGCPVLASRGGAVPEVGGDAARYCDARDEEEWTRSIQALQNDPERLAEMSAKGRDRARQFTWQRAAKQIMSALTERTMQEAEVAAIQ